MFTMATGIAFILGVIGWTLAEYSIHRWVFHGRSRWEAAQQHREHHRDVEHFATWAEKGKAAAQVIPLFMIPLWLIAGLAIATGFTAGFAGMYLVYSQFHENTHRVAPKTAYGRWCRKVHFTHHFHTPRLNHGVTCPWWDMVFGTYAPAEQIRVPERQAMDWLIDPETGDVYPEYAADYALKRKRQMRKAA